MQKRHSATPKIVSSQKETLHKKSIQKCVSNLINVWPRKLFLNQPSFVDDKDGAGQLAIVGPALVFHRINKYRHRHFIFVLHSCGQLDSLLKRLWLSNVLESHLSRVGFLLVDDQNLRFLGIVLSDFSGDRFCIT